MASNNPSPYGSLPPSYPFLDTGDVSKNPEGYARGTVFQPSAYKDRSTSAADQDWFDRWGKYALAGIIASPALYAAIAAGTAGAGTAGAATGAATGASEATIPTLTAASIPATAAPTAATLSGAPVGALAASPAASSAALPTAASTAAGAGTVAQLAKLAPLAASLYTTVHNRGNGTTPQSAGIQSLIDYQKYRLAMTDPAAAGYLGVNPGPGAVPLTPAVVKMAYSMLPVFARASAQQTMAAPTTGAGARFRTVDLTPK